MEKTSNIPLYISQVYGNFGEIISEFKADNESKTYHACSFKVNEKIIIYRSAKTTPTKVGQFVTIWKRNEQGITAPFDHNDNFDFIIINCEYGDLAGQFIFPKSVLLDKKIISGSNSSGKRGIRVYPVWDKTLNNQAQKTQQWQLNYFVDFSDEARLSFFKNLIAIS